MKHKALLNKVGLWSATAAASAALVIGIAPITAKALTIPTEVTEEGKNTYKKYCSPCHGEEGKGDGPLARSMLPKPRDFTRGAYKFRTTPSGSLPTDEDMYRTISYGVPNSTMIPWDILTEEQRTSVIPLLKSFSEAFEVRKPEAPVDVGLEVRPTEKTVADGKKIYEEKLECWKCHGVEGRGDGPSAAEQEDDFGFPIKPFDFTTGKFKGGNSSRDVYLRFTTGLNGTPMPSFAKELTDEQRWYLTHYVISLIKPEETSK
ncbi:MAG: cytochrome c [Candidatus Brocadiaceae bacterium]|uniref:c-type cytochrome n=1 Tax=Candidatus Wunengus sp. YC61 TaxID=3367698 RepID=UPI002725027D|nr:cytochrome c [Candidatus Brocadiaceae bacterium]